jgi:hypothetical protein
MNRRDTTVRGMCIVDGCDNLQGHLNYNTSGQRTYRVLCSTCHKQGQRTKKTYCEHCGFVALHKVQLDIDHIDGNKANHAKENIQTLCANCHRLKTHANQDWSSQYGVQMSKM